VAEVVAAEVVDHNRRALAGELQRDPAADAMPGAGHDRDAAIEFSHAL
jgi:hypothetical protein